MEKQINGWTNDKATAYQEATKEKRFSASELLQELAPLISDYFWGNVQLTKDGISITFPNRQKFRLCGIEL